MFDFFRSPLFIFTVILGLFYLFLFRNKKSQENTRKSMLNQLKRGDRIKTRGGISPPRPLLHPSTPCPRNPHIKPGLDSPGYFSLLYEKNPPPGGTNRGLTKKVPNPPTRRAAPEGLHTLFRPPRGAPRLEIQ